MSESGQPSVGQVLRDAREAQGITVEDAAVRLRLMHRQIEAMETDAFESLGQPVFARGFVRNYARLLGLAPDELLARMEGAPAEPAAVSHVEPPLPRSWLASPWLILLMLGALLMVTVPVGLYWWLNSGADESPVGHAPVAQPRPVPVAPVPAALPVAEPLATPAEPVAVELPVEAGSPVASEPAIPESPVVSGVVRLEFGAEAWTEIKDASGRMLHRQLNQPGSSIEVRGLPPFEMVVGNAAQARMTYNGRPIDLKPFIDVTVARFTLEE
jgi:cytoskeleton protein RodZ